jgi:hypothetical protein
LQNFLAQRATPQIAYRVVDVVGVADAGDDAFRRVVEDVAVSVDLMGLAPGGDGGVFRCGNGVAGAL